MQKSVSPKIHKFTLSKSSQVKILQEKGQYPHPKSSLLPSLHLAYQETGYLSPEVLRDIAFLLGFSYTEVSEVASFYTMFPKMNMGKYFIQVCTNISCYLCGSSRVTEYLQQKLGIKVGEVTPDGLFSLGSVECLGSCSTAPVIQVNNEDYVENLTREKIDRLIEELKNRK
jgi:NADH-quinone oxidoreductase subunit E